MIFERNSIQTLNNKKVMYATFPYDDTVSNKEYDYLDIKNINLVTIKPLIIPVLYSDVIKEELVLFNFSYNDNDSEPKTIIEAAIPSKVSVKMDMDLQDLVDALASSIGSITDINDNVIISNIKSIANDKIREKLFKQNGIISLDTDYKFGGKILCSNDTIATINSLYCSKDSTLILKDCTSLMSLKNYDYSNLKVEFFTGVKKIIIEGFEIVDMDENAETKQYSIKTNNITSEEFENIDVEYIATNSSIDLNSNLSKLTGITDIISKKNTMEIEDIFDDIF